MYFAPTALLFFVYNQTEYFYEMMRNAVAFLESAIQIIRLETVPFCRTVPVCIGDLNVKRTREVKRLSIDIFYHNIPDLASCLNESFVRFGFFVIRMCHQNKYILHYLKFFAFGIQS